jgi:hypothetical protein
VTLAAAIDGPSGTVIFTTALAGKFAPTMFSVNCTIKFGLLDAGMLAGVTWLINGTAKGGCVWLKPLVAQMTRHRIDSPRSSLLVRMNASSREVFVRLGLWRLAQAGEAENRSVPRLR